MKFTTIVFLFILPTNWQYLSYLTLWQKSHCNTFCIWQNQSGNIFISTHTIFIWQFSLHRSVLWIFCLFLLKTKSWCIYSLISYLKFSLMFFHCCVSSKLSSLMVSTMVYIRFRITLQQSHSKLIHNANIKYPSNKESKHFWWNTFPLVFI